MSGEFDVFFAGECLDGFTREAVTEGIARTFKLTPDAAAKLMDGGRHRIKGGCDKTTALRYREAMAKIGAKVVIARPETGTEAEAPAPVTTAQSHADPHDHRDAKARVSGPAAFEEQPSKVPHDAAAMAHTGDETIPWEAPETPQADPEPALSLAPVGAILGNEEGERPYALVDVPDYDVSAAGEVIPTLPDEREPLNPNTDHLHMVTEDSH